MRHLMFLALAVALSPGAAPPPTDDFHMTVRDVFSITGRGVVITGIVEGGPVSMNQVVCLRPADGEAREVTVQGIEVFREIIETAEPGMAVGLLFEGIERTDAKAGDMLTATCD